MIPILQTHLAALVTIENTATADAIGETKGGKVLRHVWTNHSSAQTTKGGNVFLRVKRTENKNKEQQIKFNPPAILKAKIKWFVLLDLATLLFESVQLHYFDKK